MRSFKKAVGAVALFLALALLFSCIIAVPAFMPDSLYNDSETRRALTGSIDTVFCGASHALSAFVPEVVDNAIGTCSYNLSGYAASFESRDVLLRKELSRNNVKTVVMEISFDALQIDHENEFVGEVMTVCKLDTAGEKLAYFLKHARLKDAEIDMMYAMLMRYGLNGWKAKLRGNVNIPQTHRGYIPTRSNDVSIPAELVEKKYNSRSFNAPLSDKGIAQLKQTLEYCRAQGAEPIIAVVPISDSLVWTFSDIEEVHQSLKGLADELGCRYVDFNLYKDKARLLSDKESFMDESHMSEQGARVFSAEFARLLDMLARGEDIDELFLDSYDELKLLTPYASMAK